LLFSVTGGGVDEVEIGLLVRPIQTNHEIEGRLCVLDLPGLRLCDKWLPAGLTRRRQYRRVVVQLSSALLSSR
jgi:hypothetical protein